MASEPRFSAVKFQTLDIAACETFFTQVFGFTVTHRYGSAGEPFEEIVMSLPGEGTTMLKFVQASGMATATGATIQIVVADVAAAMASALAAHASTTMEATDYPEAGVRMAVITTAQGLAIELVQGL